MPGSPEDYKKLAVVDCSSVKHFLPQKSRPPCRSLRDVLNVPVGQISLAHNRAYPSRMPFSPLLPVVTVDSL